MKASYLAHYLYDNGVSVAWLAIRDPFAGHKRVYTVYRILLSSSKQALVIGRELDLRTARKLVKDEMERVR